MQRAKPQQQAVGGAIEHLEGATAEVHRKLETQHTEKNEKDEIRTLKDTSQLWIINPMKCRRHMPAGPLIGSAWPWRSKAVGHSMPGSWRWSQRPQRSEPDVPQDRR